MMDTNVLASASGVTIRHVVSSSTPFIVAVVAIPSLVFVIGLIEAFATRPAGKRRADYVGYAGLACVLSLIFCLLAWALSYSVLQDKANKANTAIIESHYGISALNTDHWLVPDGSTVPRPVTFMNDAGLVHGDIVIMGDRATLYVGSSAQRTEYKGEASVADGEARSKGSDSASPTRGGNGHDGSPSTNASRR